LSNLSAFNLVRDSVTARSLAENNRSTLVLVAGIIKISFAIGSKRMRSENGEQVFKKF